VFESQRARLLRGRAHLCQIGSDVGRKGMKDDEIIPLLRTLRRPTFITRDRDFFDKTLCTDRMCLVYLETPPLEVAEFARRVLRHVRFKARRATTPRRMRNNSRSPPIKGARSPLRSLFSSRR
jgi:hypothetical protein